VSEREDAGAAGPSDIRSIVDRSPIGILVFGLRDQRVLVANRAVVELVGTSQSAIVGRRPAQLWDGVDGRRSQTALSGLALGAVDSYRAHGLLRTSRGPLAVSVWVGREELVDRIVAVMIVSPETEPKVATRSVADFLGPEAVDLSVGLLNSQWRIDHVTPTGGEVLGHDQSHLAGVELGSLVHPDDVDLLLRSVRNTAERSEDTFVRVRLRHATRGWAETRCLFFPVPEDDRSPVAFVLAETGGERIAILERHLLRFAAELHAGGWRGGAQLAVDASHNAALDELPGRKREIVDRLLQGERIASIAASLHISASTVRNHLSHVFSLFGVHSQSELLALLRSEQDGIQRGGADDRG
jgi:DNA-binding CsgD family transcriptional regulator